MDNRKTPKDNKQTDIARIVYAPVNDKLEPQKRLEACLWLSELITKMATHTICHTIVDYENLATEERMSVASAFLQRMTSTHLCNHKLTKEGIALRYQGETFQLHEEFKTVMLTRSVYEHLVMFYFLYEHPRTDEERKVVWDYWKINSMKNLIDLDTEERGEKKEERGERREERGMIDVLRNDIFSTRLGMECCTKLDEWTAPDKPTQNSCIAFFRRQGQQDVRRVSYNQAWRFLFNKDQEDMNLLYRHLSIHAHPIYNGLLQYQDQSQKDEGYDGVPLYLSCCFLAYLCRLFLRLIPNGDKMFDQDFTNEERLIFRALAKVGIR